MIEEKNQDKKKFKLNILGDQFTVTGEFSEEYINKLAEHVEKTGQELKNAYPKLPFRRLSHLTMLNLADEYFKLRSQCVDLSKDKERLKEANQSLHQELKKLRQENEELNILLEEVD